DLEPLAEASERRPAFALGARSGPLLPRPTGGVAALEGEHAAGPQRVRHVAECGRQAVGGDVLDGVAGTHDEVDVTGRRDRRGVAEHPADPLAARLPPG